ncbi:myeloid leukemia factor isoform X2 [Harmonia axyridis]|uniref:myeloid leukemia factor isoform X2 n=1 Tax=Harmonia axyridis TaxID=115357 RepID=UPI001E27883F|nr:myeloid leukemia factor isoform X2 [Harmonia axyridis]
MSLFGDFDMLENDPFFGSHMRTMRQMNSMVNSLLADPFGDMMGGFGNFMSPRPHRNMFNSMMPIMPNFNRLLNDNMVNNAFSSSSSTIVSMTSGPDGRPQVYKATSSTRCGPGGIKETQQTVTDSITGTKKMAIGHHIGERAHIIEKEQNMHTGEREEREELINVDDDEKEEFNHEWESKARPVRSEARRIVGSNRKYPYGAHTSSLPAITAGPRNRQASPQLVTSRRSIRASPLTLSGSSAMNKPYSPIGTTPARKNRNIKTVNGSPPPADM